MPLKKHLNDLVPGSGFVYCNEEYVVTAAWPSQFDDGRLRAVRVSNWALISFDPFEEVEPKEVDIKAVHKPDEIKQSGRIVILGGSDN